jgi:hypothetical protein
VIVAVLVLAATVVACSGEERVTVPNVVDLQQPRAEQPSPRQDSSSATSIG